MIEPLESDQINMYVELTKLLDYFVFEPMNLLKKNFKDVRDHYDYDDFIIKENNKKIVLELERKSAIEKELKEKEKEKDLKIKEKENEQKYEIIKDDSSQLMNFFV